jgi:FkbM family methyltransferase
MTLEEFERLQPIVNVQDGATEVTYCTPNRFAKWRVDTLFIKEPDTIDWIRSFSPGDVLVDIGANVGMYTIWAAKTRGTRVLAFEPESQNFALLNKNIVANGLGDTATAYCVALSDENAFSVLHLSDFAQGGSGHSLGVNLDHNLKPRSSPYAQGCVTTTLDHLVQTGVVPAPTHIKIDVDGLEHKVIAGARATLRDQRLKSVLIEINSNLDEHRHIVQELVELGFSYKDEQVRAARRTTGPSTGTGNYVFRR